MKKLKEFLGITVSITKGLTNFGYLADPWPKNILMVLIYACTKIVLFDAWTTRIRWTVTTGQKLLKCFRMIILKKNLLWHNSLHKSKSPQKN